MEEQCEAWTLLTFEQWRKISQGISHLEKYDEHPEWIDEASSLGAQTFRRLLEDKLKDYQGFYPFMLYYSPAYGSDIANDIVNDSIDSDIATPSDDGMIVRVRSPKSRFAFATDYAYLRIRWETYVARTLEESDEFEKLIRESGYQYKYGEVMPQYLESLIGDTWETNVFVDPKESGLFGESTYAFTENIYPADIVSARKLINTNVCGVKTKDVNSGGESMLM